MNFIPRIQAIITKPKEEWVKIKGEQTSVMSLFMTYVIPLAAIPAIAQFIGYGLIGRRVLSFGVFRYPIGRAFFQSILTYVLAIVTAYVAGIVVNALAPTFASKQNLENAMKLVVYSLIPGWIGGVFYIFLPLGFLAAIASLYGLYILYLGFQSPMMDTPQDKVMSYLVVSILVVAGLVIVSSVVVGTIFAVGTISGL